MIVVRTQTELCQFFEDVKARFFPSEPAPEGLSRLLRACGLAPASAPLTYAYTPAISSGAGFACRFGGHTHVLPTEKPRRKTAKRAKRGTVKKRRRA